MKGREIYKNALEKADEKLTNNGDYCNFIHLIEDTLAKLEPLLQDSCQKELLNDYTSFELRILSIASELYFREGIKLGLRLNKTSDKENNK